MRRFLSVVALSAALVPLYTNAAPACSNADVAARLDNHMRGGIPDLRTPGVSLVLVEGDQVILSRGYGLANRETGTPMTEETPVGVASNTKGMTALALMQLVEQDLVDLDVPVMRYPGGVQHGRRAGP
jgi:CubicO group peptidase (beta-lactamase class C family)